MRAASQPPSGVPLPETDEERITELVVANRILVSHKVLDGFGHISVRSARDPSHYLMARGGIVPDQVTPDDIIEYDEDSKPVGAGGRNGPGERFMHGEVYRIRPDVYSVLHCHTSAVLPFTTTSAPLQALIHTASFLGSEPAPVFDPRDASGGGDPMLVDNGEDGSTMAATLAQRAVVLIRGHGMTVAAPSVHDAVFRGVYTRINAQVELDALKIGNPRFLSAAEVERGEPVSMQWSWWSDVLE